jgi:hypothetical protein
MDVGHFLDDASDEEKLAYDLASLLASLLENTSPE